MADSTRMEIRGGGLAEWARLLRPFHWLKNLLVVFPLFFANRLADPHAVACTMVGFLAFDALASFIYVLNDLSDAEHDRAHPTKCRRPIASGAISVRAAVVGLIILGLLVVILATVALSLSRDLSSLAFIGGYLIINIAYSRGLKALPIVDVAIIAGGFILRVFYGAALIGVFVSDWLFLTVASASFFLGFGKRRNEIRRSGAKSRVVLDRYSLGFLTPIMYMFLGLTIAFYSLWAIQAAGDSRLLKYTILLVMIILADYARIIENGDSDGDPAEVLRKSRALLALSAVFMLLLGMSLY